MATIKSFTYLPQSKVLAKILPLESADMHYNDWTYDFYDGYEHTGHFKAYLGSPIIICGEQDIPCWSLAALLSVIPQEIFDGEYIINITEGWDNKWILTYDHHENRNHSYYTLSIGADNLVDACYEMILKLHELKML